MLAQYMHTKDGRHCCVLALTGAPEPSHGDVAAIRIIESRQRA